MNTAEAVGALHELATARDAGLIPEWEAGQRAAAILDRSEWKPLDMTEYLTERGITGANLARVMPTFATAVKHRYLAAYGCQPLKRVAVVGGRQVLVMAYVEHDRPIFDRTFWWEFGR